MHVYFKENYKFVSWRVLFVAVQTIFYVLSKHTHTDIHFSICFVSYVTTTCHFKLKSRTSNEVRFNLTSLYSMKISIFLFALRVFMTLPRGKISNGALFLFFAGNRMGFLVVSGREALRDLEEHNIECRRKVGAYMKLAT